MSIWTEYNNRTPAGVAGGLYDLTAHVVDSFRIDAADGKVKCGMGVVHGTNPGSDVTVPAATSTIDKFVGVVMNGGSNEMDMNGKIVIRKDSQQSVMRSGRIWVRLASDAEPSCGDQAHLILSGNDLGCFSTTGGMAVNARFVTKAQNGIAVIELYNQIGGAGSGLSTAADVDLSTPPTNGQTLKYDSTSGKWKPGT